MSKARMLFTDPEYRRKYVEYGVDYNPFDGADMYQWTRKIQRYAKYEPSHPLNVGSRQFDVMEPFKGGELSNPYREQIDEFRGEKDEEEKPVVKNEMTTQTQPISDVFGRVITARKYDTSVPTSRTTRTNNGVQDGKVEMKKKMVEAGTEPMEKSMEKPKRTRKTKKRSLTEDEITELIAVAPNARFISSQTKADELKNYAKKRGIDTEGLTNTQIAQVLIRGRDREAFGRGVPRERETYRGMEEPSSISETERRGMNLSGVGETSLSDFSTRDIFREGVSRARRRLGTVFE